MDPNDANIVFALGLFNYGTGSGGVFRSTDGGQTWKDMGWDLHPDYHAVAINPANTSQVMIGSDGGVWYSPDRGGRLGAGDPVDSVDWQDLNGTVDPNTAAVIHRTHLNITQFTSIANVPTIPARVWGGTQDNGTLRKSAASNSWFDVESGDGGQVIVDPTDANFVYGNYFSISPYRNTDGGLAFFSNSFITGGIDLSDRSEFYVPEVMNQGNPNQLFLGTYRLYRTDNAKADDAAAVHWDAISPDLTSGCEGGAPNGARGCLLSAIGVSSGGDGVYTGSLEGWIKFSPDAVTSLTPTWKRVGKDILPNRPVSDIAVDRSNDRIAYAGYNGFNEGTPGHPGHVFKTTDAGKHWKDISSNLPTTRSTRSRSMRPIRTRSMPAPTSARSSPTTAARAGRPSAPASRPSRSGSSPSTRPTATSARARTDAAPGRCMTRRPCRPSWSARRTPASRSDPAARSTTPSRSATSATRRPRGHGHRPDPGQHDLHQCRRRWHARPWQGQQVHVDRPDHRGRRQRRSPFRGDHRHQAQGQGHLDRRRRHHRHLHPERRRDRQRARRRRSLRPTRCPSRPASQTDGARVGGSVDYILHVTNVSFNNDTYTLGATVRCVPGDDPRRHVRLADHLDRPQQRRVGRRLPEGQRPGRHRERGDRHGDPDRDLDRRPVGQRQRHGDDHRGRRRRPRWSTTTITATSRCPTSARTTRRP